MYSQNLVLYRMSSFYVLFSTFFRSMYRVQCRQLWFQFFKGQKYENMYMKSNKNAKRMRQITKISSLSSSQKLQNYSIWQ